MNFQAKLVRILERYKARRNRSATVRFMFPAALGMAALLGAVSITAVNSSFVLLETEVQAIEKGDLFEVQVLTSAHTPVNAVDITVSFPADSLEVFSVDRGQSVLTIWTEDPIIESNSVQLSGGTFRRGFIGEHEIATIVFRSVETGQFTVAVSEARLVAGDGAGTEVEVSSVPSNTISLFTYDENTPSETINKAVTSGIVTDLNNDGKVTLQDISAFMGAWSSRSQVFDFDNDGKMSFRDFSIILASYFLQ